VPINFSESSVGAAFSGCSGNSDYQVTLFQDGIPMMKRWLTPVLLMLAGAAPLLAQYTVVAQAPAPAASAPPTQGSTPPPGSASVGEARTPPADAVDFPPPPGPDPTVGGPGTRHRLDRNGAGVTLTEGQYFWLSGEYLLLWTKTNTLPPLVSGGPKGGPQSLLFGGDDPNDMARSGGHFQIGLWLDDMQEWSLRSDALVIGDRAANFDQASSPQFPVLTSLGERVAFPGEPTTAPVTVTIPAGTTTAVTVPTRTGPVTIPAGAGPVTVVGEFPATRSATGAVSSSRTSRIFGFDFDLGKNLCCADSYRVDVLAGFRYLTLNETFRIEESRTRTLQPMVPAALAGFANPADLTPSPTIASLTDAYTTNNRFIGGEVGGSAEVYEGRWVFSFLGKVAFGRVKEKPEVAGIQAVTRGIATTTTTFNNNLAATVTTVGVGTTTTATAGNVTTTSNTTTTTAPSNSGLFNRNTFAALPEAGVTVGYQVTDNVRLYGGYNFLYLSDVFRANEPPVASIVVQPGHGPVGVPPRSTDFWAQGISAGLEVRY
jgi:hypothetical protein